MRNFTAIAKLRIAIGLLISLIFIAYSCSIAGYKPVTNSSEINVKELYIFDHDFKKALYSTTFSIYGYELTGLTLIKRTDSAMRVVSMSELGMKYFDFEFHDNKQYAIHIHYIMEPLNKKVVIDKISKEFSLLFYLTDLIKSRVKISKKDRHKMLIKNNKLVYYFDQSGTITEICKQRWPFSMKQIICVSENNNSESEAINIDYGSVSFDLELID